MKFANDNLRVNKKIRNFGKIFALFLYNYNIVQYTLYFKFQQSRFIGSRASNNLTRWGPEWQRRSNDNRFLLRKAPRFMAQIFPFPLFIEIGWNSGRIKILVYWCIFYIDILPRMLLVSSSSTQREKCIYYVCALYQVLYRAFCWAVVEISHIFCLLFK